MSNETAAEETKRITNDLLLLEMHEREHQELTRRQLERDGKIWDRILGRWIEQ